MAIQQFELLKKSAVTEIQADLEAAVLADRLLAESARDAAQLAQTAAETAETNAELAETNAELAETNAEAAKNLAVAAANAFPATNPQVAYHSRVLADSGVIKDLEELTKHYLEVLQIKETAEIIWSGEAGYKLTDTKYSKVYNMAANAYDLTATVGNEFQSSGSIAPNELMRVNGLTGETGTKDLIGTTKQYTEAQAFTAIITLKPNKLSATATRIYTSASNYFLLTSTAITYVGDTGNVLTATYSLAIGKFSIIELQYNNGAGLIKVNNVPVTTTASSMATTFGRLQLNQTTYNFDGSIAAFELYTGRLSESASSANYAYNRVLHPEIEGIAIGNQYFATSNYEGVVTGNGTVIPEVQDATAWAALTTPAWCYYNNDASLGAVYGKLYNWYAVNEIAKNPPKDWRVPSYEDFFQLRDYSGGQSIAGKKLKIIYGNNSVGTNETGFSMLGTTSRSSNGEFTTDDANYNKLWLSTDSGLTTANHSATYSYWSELYIDPSLDKRAGCALRLLRNEPVGSPEETISQTIAANTDYASTALQMPMKFGYRASLIRITSENELTSVEVKLHNSAGTAVATLITAKSVAAGATMVFPVMADYATLLNDGTLRMTAVGNIGSTVGGKFEATCQKEIFS